MNIINEIDIVDYIPGDYDKLIHIWDKAELLYKSNGRDSREKIENEIKLDCNRFLFARLKDQYIASILVTHDGRKGWINRVAVLPEYRNKSLARLLVEKAEEWLDSVGIDIYACQIEPDNPDSLEVFIKLNYIPFEGMHYLTKRKYPDV